MEKPNPNERFEGVDRTVLDEDVWAEKPVKDVCPKCGLAVEPGTLRCPRCNALVIMGCGGSCASCGSRRCVKRDEQT